MRTQSATTTITRAVTVAAGVFAPGHLGELTQYLPFELVDDVLEQTRTVQRRLRDLPSRAGVYFVLALGMFPRLGYARVWAKLTAGLAGLDVPCPSEKALRDLRRRLGPAPLKALFEVVAGPLAQPRTPGVRFAGLRTVAFDGCNSLKVPDTGRNRCVAGPDPVPDGLCRVSHAAADGAGRDRHPRPARRRARLGRRPGRGHRGPAAAAPAAARACWSCWTGPSTRNAFLRRGRRHRGDAAGAGQVHPQPAGPGPPARRLLPVATWTGWTSGSSRPA